MIRHAYQSITAEVDHIKNEHIKKTYILKSCLYHIIKVRFHFGMLW